VLLRADQQAAVDAAVKQLRRAGSRGLYVEATGTGKTLTSIRIADALGARLVLVLAPDLLAQTALAWRADGHYETMLIVSSMDAAGHDGLVARRVGSTSDAAALARLMAAVGEGPDQIPALTVLCSYDSLDKVEAAGRTGRAVSAFDLAVMDEAHRIAGRAEKKWAMVNDATRIRADRRLYMTATPRQFRAPELAESANPNRPRLERMREQVTAADTAANSLENTAVYGKKIFDYPLAQAVADGTAADYRIVVPTITSADLRDRLNLSPRTGEGDAHTPESALRTTALHLAVLKAMAERACGAVVTHGRAPEVVACLGLDEDDAEGDAGGCVCLVPARSCPAPCGHSDSDTAECMAVRPVAEIRQQLCTGTSGPPPPRSSQGSPRRTSRHAAASPCSEAGANQSPRPRARLTRRHFWD
jgi:hypothetical protein